MVKKTEIIVFGGLLMTKMTKFNPMSQGTPLYQWYDTIFTIFTIFTFLHKGRKTNNLEVLCQLIIDY